MGTSGGVTVNGGGEGGADRVEVQSKNANTARASAVRLSNGPLLWYELFTELNSAEKLGFESENCISVQCLSGIMVYVIYV